MIGFGLWLLFSGHGGEKPVSITSGVTVVFLPPAGMGYFVAGGNYVLFRRSGADWDYAAEARDPEKSIPKAVNQVVYASCCFISVHWWFYWHSIRG